MDSIIIYGSKSLTISSKLPDDSISEDVIMVGKSRCNTYESYLYFDISPVPDNIVFKCAELVLFKTTDFFEDKQNKLAVYPLKEYFSSSTTYNNCAKYYDYLKKCFYPYTRKAAVEVDITRIVQEWLEGKIANKGLLLSAGCECTPLTCFGSTLNCDKTLIPLIRICYEKLPCVCKVCIPPNKPICTPIPKSSITTSIQCS